MLEANEQRPGSLIGAPWRLVQGVFQRCDSVICNIGRPRPLAWLRVLVPRRRPLLLLSQRECSVGIFKVERRNGQRCMVLQPVKPRQACSIDDALEMF